MISLQSGRDLPRRPELLQPRLDLRDQPRTPRELRRFRPPRAPRRPALSPHRPIAPPTTPGPDLPAHRRGRTPQHPGNRPTRLPSRDPTTDPLSLPRRKPEPRMRSPPLQQHRRIPSPLDRPDRNPELRRNPSQPHILPSPRSNPRTLIRPHHPIRLTNTPTLRHQISNLSTQNTNHVALTDGHHPCPKCTLRHGLAEIALMTCCADSPVWPAGVETERTPSHKPSDREMISFWISLVPP